ncbi:MAG: nucleotide exchange factor GrpE [Alphaproteobacteria bacterium]|nr:nucleotide exchange factor GrpE [Alphaproteobacteria bacterium]
MNTEKPEHINTDNDENENSEAQNAEENVVNLEENAPAQQTSQTPEDQIAALQKELLDARDRTMRALADAENTRKRAQKDREDAGKYAVANFARDMLAFGDNFARALKSLPDSTPVAVTEGLNAMDKELLSTFERHGVRKIEPLDEPFDANYHEVMFEVATPGKTAGTIIQVIEPGYVLNDRLLRAAKVGIAKAESNTPSGEHQIDQEA